MPKPVTVTTPSDREVVVVRAFDAPARLVWDAHTKPELLKRWLFGPSGWSMPYCMVDLRVGGAYRYLWRNEATGAQFGAYGDHLEVVTHQRIVSTQLMDGLDGRPVAEEPVRSGDEPSVIALDLVESDGRTTLTVTMKFPSKLIRDMAVQSGMTDGMAAGYDRLDEQLGG